MNPNQTSLCQLADAIQNATAEFLEKYPINRDKIRINEEMERSLSEICQRHRTPYQTVRKIVTYS